MIIWFNAQKKKVTSLRSKATSLWTNNNKKDKSRIRLNKANYVGTVILQSNKIKIICFHQKCIKVKYGEIAKMLLTDTKRFYYITETENFYEDYYKGKE